MIDQSDDTLLSRIKKAGLDISKIVIGMLGFLYGVGYLIQAITLRNYGIQRLESLKFQYVEIGLTFTVLFLLVTVIPVACVFVHHQIRRRSELPHYRFGAVVFSLNTYNLLFLIVFSGLFITNQEWGTSVLAGRIPLSQILVIYLVIAGFVLVGMPVLERRIVAHYRHIKTAYFLLVEPLRVGAVALGFLVDILYVSAFPWIANLALHGLTFVASAVGLAAVAAVIIYYIKRLADKYSMPFLVAIGLTGLLLLLYICLNAYVYSIVRHIPMNRGGRLPITRSYLISVNEELCSLPVHQTEQGIGTVFGPVYVLEETQDYLFVAAIDAQNWFQEWATTYAIRKDTVAYIRNDRIRQGGPRYPSEAADDREETDDIP